MNISFNPALVRTVRNLLVIILIAKVLSLLMLWYFPSEGVNYHPSSSKMPEYKRYSVQNIINPAESPAGLASEGDGPAAYGPNISNMVLKALYKRKSGGFVIIALKANPDASDVIGIGESFQGYMLKNILNNGAVFAKKGQSYSLFFTEEEPAPRSATASSAEGIKQVGRSDIAYYTKHVDQIWRDISISEVMKEGKITGFEVTSIKAGTPFATLGLRKGDIIIKANNKPMTSYKDALEI
ncbi:MAG: PDZ domain-containing protein, partial [Thiovulaceae bacterium]|nr:PDZ domain-containing protein [Sulfurimonadaceae bacterium]